MFWGITHMRKSMFTCVAIAASLAAGMAYAAPIVDQENLFVSGGGFPSTGSAYLQAEQDGTITERRDYQTITAGLTGRLTAVDLAVRGRDIPGILNVSLYDGVREEAEASLIGSASTPIANLLSTDDILAGEMVRFDFSAFDYNVNVGQVFSIELSVSADETDVMEFGLLNAGWVYGRILLPDDPEGETTERFLSYDRGFARGSIAPLGAPFDWKPRGADRAFRTFVDVAATDVPAPGVLALFGLGLAGVGFARTRRAD